MSLIEVYSGWRTYAQAMVFVVDSNGDPVEGAAVAGHWEQATADADSGVTGPEGTVKFESNRVRFPPSATVFVFVIDSVAREGWSYDADISVTIGQIVVP